MNGMRPLPAGGSVWMEGVTPTAPALAGDVAADVAIVGAGFTGLSAAAALRAAGHSVVVLEAEHVGFGASGRNAGHLTPVIGKDLPTLAGLFRKRAPALIALVELAVAHVERTIAEHAIDCAYEPVGNLLAAVHPRQHGMLDKAAKAAAALGLAHEMLEPDAMRARDLPAAFTRGLLMKRGGILHPGRYVEGLRRIAESAGARVFERTPVVRLEAGTPAVLTTPGGRVRARTVVLGTNAWTPALGWLRGTIARFHVYLFATAPLDEERRAAIGWRGREGIYTAHEMLESWRLTDDGRIVGGAKTVRYGFGGRALEDDPATFAFLEDAFRDRFPALRDVPVTHRWGGPIAFALDFLPAVGVTGVQRNVYYSAGYAGHGIAMASYAGTMLADLMLGRDGPGRALWGRRKVPMPPEPLRWLVARGLVGAFGAMDRRIDRLAGRR
jgi:glycine/D-amino acid oxidase-like deaminating enzyme